jgi:hypothetical protein
VRNKGILKIILDKQIWHIALSFLVFPFVWIGMYTDWIQFGFWQVFAVGTSLFLTYFVFFFKKNFVEFFILLMYVSGSWIIPEVFGQTFVLVYVLPFIMAIFLFLGMDVMMNADLSGRFDLERQVAASFSLTALFLWINILFNLQDISVYWLMVVFEAFLILVIPAVVYLFGNFSRTVTGWSTAIVIWLVSQIFLVLILLPFGEMLMAGFFILFLQFLLTSIAGAKKRTFTLGAFVKNTAQFLVVSFVLFYSYFL